MQSATTPTSKIIPTPPDSFGKIDAMQGRITPLIGEIENIEPTNIAPEFPALAKTSISPLFNKENPIVILLSGFCLMAFVA